MRRLPHCRSDEHGTALTKYLVQRGLVVGAAALLAGPGSATGDAFESLAAGGIGAPPTA